MEATDEMIAMLERIREQHWPNFDNAVLAAIIETTERAAKYAATLMPMGDAADEAEWFHGHCEGTDNVARALRDNRHLKGPDNAQ